MMRWARFPFLHFNVDDVNDVNDDDDDDDVDDDNDDDDDDDVDDDNDDQGDKSCKFQFVMIFVVTKGESEICSHKG